MPTPRELERIADAIVHPDGLYHVKCANGTILKTHIRPIDATNMVTWADTLIQATKDVLRGGFGVIHTGEPYDLNNYLCDTHAGNVPWTVDKMKLLYAEFLKHPEFVPTMTAWIEKYGRCHFELTYEDYARACQGEELE